MGNKVTTEYNEKEDMDYIEDLIVINKQKDSEKKWKDLINAKREISQHLIQLEVKEFVLNQKFEIEKNVTIKLKELLIEKKANLLRENLGKLIIMLKNKKS